MKTFINLILTVILIITINTAYASDVNVDPEFMDEESVDYDTNSVQTSAPEDEDASVETRERSEYNVDMRPYVNFKYVSTRSKIEHK